MTEWKKALFRKANGNHSYRGPTEVTVSCTTTVQSNDTIISYRLPNKRKQRAETHSDVSRTADYGLPSGRLACMAQWLWRADWEATEPLPAAGGRPLGLHP